MGEGGFSAACSAERAHARARAAARRRNDTEEKKENRRSGDHEGPRQKWAALSEEQCLVRWALD